jgi:hypothetical protein
MPLCGGDAFASYLLSGYLFYSLFDSCYKCDVKFYTGGQAKPWSQVAVFIPGRHTRRESLYNFDIFLRLCIQLDVYYTE